MRIPSLSTSAFLAALRRMQGRGGWTDADGSNRTREIEALATAASDGAVLVRDAGLAAFPLRDEAGAGIEDWETVLRVVDDFPVTTIEQRRARIVALRREVDPYDRDTLLESVEALSGVELASITAASRDEVTADETCEPEGRFVPRPRVDDPNDLQRSGLITAAARALLRILPARMLSSAALEGLVREFGVDQAIEWGSDGNLLRDRLGDASVSPYAHPPARIVSFAPRSRLTAADLNAIQREIVWRGGLLVGASSASPGVVNRLIVVDLSTSKDRIVDQSLDWRNRFLRISARIHNADFLPGGSFDSVTGTAEETFMHSRAGGASSEATYLDLTWYVDASGRLCVKTALAGARFVRAFITATGFVNASGGAIPTRFEVEAPSTDWLEDLVFESHIRRGSVNNQAWPNDPVTGGLIRCGFLVNTVRPSPETATTVYVLDASCDWRDRLLQIDIIGRQGDFGVIPGANDSVLGSGSALGAVGGVFYTGPGASRGAGNTVSSYQFSVWAGLWIYAQQDTGYLVAQRKGGFPPDEPITFGFVVRASQQTGQYIEPLQVPALPIGGEITPADLHVLQDFAVMQQFTGQRVDTLDVATPRPPAKSQAMPLGCVTSGTPAVPREWLVRERIGERRDLEERDRFQRRQTLSGAIRFPIGLTCAVGMTPVEFSDYRDRIITIIGRRSGSDIRVGGASNSVVNAATAFKGSHYTGPGTTDANDSDYCTELGGSTLRLVVRESDGGLWIRNTGASTVYVVAMIDATAPLGPRSRG